MEILLVFHERTFRINGKHKNYHAWCERRGKRTEDSCYRKLKFNRSDWHGPKENWEKRFTCTLKLPCWMVQMHVRHLHIIGNNVGRHFIVEKKFGLLYFTTAKSNCYGSAQYSIYVYVWSFIRTQKRADMVNSDCPIELMITSIK